MNQELAKNFIECLIFSASEPMHLKSLEKILSSHGDFNLKDIMEELTNEYKNKGVILDSVDNRFFRTSPNLDAYLQIETKKTKNLSPAAIETLAIISYHQPVTRAEIEKIRGKPVFRGTLDSLLELKWIKPAGRRETQADQ